MLWGAHFGSGMRHGSTCGAVSGALMVLGLLDAMRSSPPHCLRLPDTSRRAGLRRPAPGFQGTGESCARTTATAWSSRRCLDFWRNCSGSRAPDPDRGVGGGLSGPRPPSVSSTSVSSCSQVSWRSFDLRPAGDLSLQFLPCNIPEDIFDPQVGWQDILNDLRISLNPFGMPGISGKETATSPGISFSSTWAWTPHPEMVALMASRVKLSPPIRISAARAFRIPVGVSATGRRASRAMIRSSPQLSGLRQRALPPQLRQPGVHPVQRPALDIQLPAVEGGLQIIEPQRGQQLPQISPVAHCIASTVRVPSTGSWSGSKDRSSGGAVSS